MDVVEWIEKIMKKIARWLDGQEKQNDGQMDIKNGGYGRKKLMYGLIKQIDRWLEGKQKYEKKLMDGWMDRKKIERWLDGQKIRDG